MHRRKRLLTIPLLFLIITYMITAAGCSSSANVKVMPMMQDRAEIKPKEHKVVIAESRTIEKYINVSALISYDQMESLSFKLDYLNLKNLYVEKDQLVEEGQLLAELDTTDYENQIAARQIDLERVQLMYDRTMNAPDMDPVDRDAELKSLDLDKEAINLDIAHLQELINEAKLVAPFAGVITSVKKVKPGEAIAGYDPIITIWKSGSIKLVSEILNPPPTTTGSTYDFDLSGIVTGMKVTLVYGSKDTRTEIPATVTRIINTDPGVEANSNRILYYPPAFQLDIKPDGDYPDKLYLDHSVALKIHTGTLEDAVVIPETLIRGFGNDHIVKVVKGDQIINRSVTIGFEDKQEGIVVITSGLRAGESVLAN